MTAPTIGRSLDSFADAGKLLVLIAPSSDPAETLRSTRAPSSPRAVEFGANPNCRDHGYKIGGHPYPGTALDYIVASYARSPQRLSPCVDILLEAGGATKYDAPAVLQLLRGRLDSLVELIDADPALVNKRFSELDCGQTGGRNLLLQGGTLLHVAAEYGTKRLGSNGRMACQASPRS